MPDVSASEILSTTVNPGTGTGGPAFVIDTKDTVRNINEAARIKSENDWRKYNQFQNNLKESFKDLSDISELEVATKDRPELDKIRGEIFEDIHSDPKGFFSGNGEKMAEIQGKINQLKTLSVESKYNNAFDFAHRKYVEQNPELNTDENKGIIEGFLKQPLGKRKPYILNQPPVFDFNTFSKGIWDNPAVTQSFADITGINADGTPGNEYLRERQGKKSIRDNFMNAWMAGLNFQKDKYGHSIRGAIESQFKQLPKETQDAFEKQGEKNKTDGITEYFRRQGELEFGSNQDIIRTEKDTVHQNPFVLQKQKAADKINELKTKHGFDISLELTKQKGRENLAAYKQELKGKSAQEQSQWLNDYVDGLRSKAISESPAIRFKNVEGIDGSKEYYELPTSAATNNIFSSSEYDSKAKKNVKHPPDHIVVDSDGKSVIGIFWKKKADGTDAIDPKTGKKMVDKEKTKHFNIDEFKARVGKDMLGVKTLGSSLTDSELDDDEPDSDSDDTILTEKFEISGKPYTKDDLLKLGYTEEQINQAIKLGTVKKK